VVTWCIVIKRVFPAIIGPGAYEMGVLSAKGGPAWSSRTCRLYMMGPASSPVSGEASEDEAEIGWLSDAPLLPRSDGFCGCMDITADSGMAVDSLLALSSGTSSRYSEADTARTLACMPYCWLGILRRICPALSITIAYMHVRPRTPSIVSSCLPPSDDYGEMCWTCRAFASWEDGTSVHNAAAMMTCPLLGLFPSKYRDLMMLRCYDTTMLRLAMRSPASVLGVAHHHCDRILTTWNGWPVSLELTG
jgi:hypothetical protein